MKELAGLRPSVRSTPAVRLLVLATAQFPRQPVRLLAQVRMSLHSAGPEPHIWGVLLHSVAETDQQYLLTVLY